VEVIMLEGILALHIPQVVERLNMKARAASLSRPRVPTHDNSDASCGATLPFKENRFVQQFVLRKQPR
jgi:hypothetical protein